MLESYLLSRQGRRWMKSCLLASIVCSLPLHVAMIPYRVGRLQLRICWVLELWAKLLRLCCVAIWSWRLSLCCRALHWKCLDEVLVPQCMDKAVGLRSALCTYVKVGVLVWTQVGNKLW